VQALNERPEDCCLKHGTLAHWAVVGTLCVLAGCAANATGQRSQGPESGPAYFTQNTAAGYRYAHNWVDRPCFTIDLPGHEWVLQSATADYVMWRQGIHALKLYLTDNRKEQFAVSGMNGDDALRAFIGFELDYIKPKFENDFSPAPTLRRNGTGLWALWKWEGHKGKRAGVGKAQPSDQKHLLGSLWLDPWVLTFDWATPKLDEPDGGPELRAVLESLMFHPQCFASMRSGETWSEPDGGGAQLAPRARPVVKATVGPAHQ